MKRAFISQRGQKISHDDRQSPDFRYSIHDAVEIFIQAKKAEGIRQSTIKGYYDTVRYFQKWLSKDIKYINQITATTIRENINYLKNDHLYLTGT